jgi:hypothetical protein
MFELLNRVNVHFTVALVTKQDLREWYACIARDFSLNIRAPHVTNHSML